MPVYTVEAYGGRMAIRYSRKKLESFTKEMENQIGSDNLDGIHLSNIDEIMWVRGMGGYLPKQALDMIKQSEKE